LSPLPSCHQEGRRLSGLASQKSQAAAAVTRAYLVSTESAGNVRKPLAIKSQAATRVSPVGDDSAGKIRNLLAIKSQAATRASPVSNESAGKVRNLLATIDNARAAKKANLNVSTAVPRVVLPGFVAARLRSRHKRPAALTRHTV
jgi:hypothetical protein